MQTGDGQQVRDARSAKLREDLRVHAREAAAQQQRAGHIGMGGEERADPFCDSGAHIEQYAVGVPFHVAVREIACADIRMGGDAEAAVIGEPVRIRRLKRCADADLAAVFGVCAAVHDHLNAPMDGNAVQRRILEHQHGARRRVLGRFRDAAGQIALRLFRHGRALQRRAEKGQHGEQQRQQGRPVQPERREQQQQQYEKSHARARSAGARRAEKRKAYQPDKNAERGEADRPAVKERPDGFVDCGDMLLFSGLLHKVCSGVGPGSEASFPRGGGRRQDICRSVHGAPEGAVPISMYPHPYYGKRARTKQGEFRPLPAAGERAARTQKRGFTTACDYDIIQINSAGKEPAQTHGRRQ